MELHAKDLSKSITYLLLSILGFGLVWRISATIEPPMYIVTIIQLLMFIVLSIIMVSRNLFSSKKIFAQKLWVVSGYGFVLGIWLGLIYFSVVNLLILGTG